MTKSVAVQHAKDKIRANSVHPGIMPPMRTSGRTADPAVRAERMRIIPMRRPGEVDEVANAILFLASDEGRFGPRLHVCGVILSWTASPNAGDQVSIRSKRQRQRVRAGDYLENPAPSPVVT